MTAGDLLPKLKGRIEKMKFGKKLVCLFLAALMLAGALPATVFAEEAEETLTRAGLSMIKMGNGTAAAYVTPQVGQKVAKGTVIIVEFH